MTRAHSGYSGLNSSENDMISHTQYPTNGDRKNQLQSLDWICLENQDRRH